MGVYVQDGCGLSCPDCWINFDASPTLRLQRLPLIGTFFRRGSVVFPPGVRYGNIVTGLPIADGSVDGIYASHVLEHLSREDFKIALRNTFGLLRPGGIFRLIVPDMEVRARMYLAKLNAGQVGANDWLLRMSGLGWEHRPRGASGWAKSFLGNSAHLWMWDERSIGAELATAGFVNIRRCRFNDSADPAFLRVEDRGRFHDSELGADECAMEGQKPNEKVS